jgi:cystathionine beta-lyase/cystathionine gamma-synthase
MAAIFATIMALVKSGDHIVASRNMFGTSIVKFETRSKENRLRMLLFISGLIAFADGFSIKFCDHSIAPSLNA